jgi:putative aldouronate transport system permease protein
MLKEKNGIVFDIGNYTFFVLLCVIMFYPLWYTLVASLMKEGEFLTSSYILYAKEPTLNAYKNIFDHGKIFNNLRVTVFITLVGSGVSLFCSTFCAYGLSKKFPGSKVLMFLIVLTMFIKPGLIPEYLNLKSWGLLNSLSVYIIPSAINTFYLIILINNFREFPLELEESAKIDGANEFYIFFKIVLPLSTAILAAIGLFFAVQYWNTYMQSVFFITDPMKKTVQEYLRNLVVETTDIEMMMMMQEGQDEMSSLETMRLANVILVLLPILFVYPFLQKYFVKGMLVGAIKG